MIRRPRSPKWSFFEKTEQQQAVAGGVDAAGMPPQGAARQRPSVSKLVALPADGTSRCSIETARLISVERAQVVRGHTRCRSCCMSGLADAAEFGCQQKGWISERSLFW